VAHLSSAVSYFIAKMMKKDPSRRYDAAGLVKDLDAFLRGEFQVPAGAFSDSSLALMVQDEARAAGAEKKLPRKKSRSRRTRSRRRH
jgi:hypothetical protein